MRFFNLSVLALVGLVASEEASYAQEPLSPFFGSSFSMLKEFIEKSAPVIDMTSKALGGPAFDGSDAIAALNGVTPMLNTFAEAAAPVADYFGFGSSKDKDEDKGEDKDEEEKPKAKHEVKEKKKGNSL